MGAPGQVVFGHHPLAVALATRLATRAPTVLAAPTPVEGPFLWRRADLQTGKGVRLAVEGARRIHVVLGDGERADGLAVVLSKAQGVRGCLALPLGASPPRGLDRVAGISRVHLGPCWGPEDPLVRSWGDTIARGRRLWLADPGVFRPVPMADAVAAVMEAAERADVRWTFTGETDVRLPELAQRLAAALGRPLRTVRVPASWAAWRAGVDVSSITTWADAPVMPRATDGWTPSRPAGPAGWVGDPSRYRAPG